LTALKGTPILTMAQLALKRGADVADAFIFVSQYPEGLTQPAVRLPQIIGRAFEGAQPYIFESKGFADETRDRIGAYRHERSTVFEVQRRVASLAVRARLTL
jgi:hypothetical protein